ncbi:hypothetical protein M885DRAFT_53224 [Pelagophyceae sp. CCMP2097]|nr:hypothetical protein M885DRAFT_53224 [Pelagophyceae sp. CCMP2097]
MHLALRPAWVVVAMLATCAAQKTDAFTTLSLKATTGYNRTAALLASDDADVDRAAQLLALFEARHSDAAATLAADVDALRAAWPRRLRNAAIPPLVEGRSNLHPGRTPPAMAPRPTAPPVKTMLREPLHCACFSMCSFADLAEFYDRIPNNVTSASSPWVKYLSLVYGSCASSTSGTATGPIGPQRSASGQQRTKPGRASRSSRAAAQTSAPPGTSRTGAMATSMHPLSWRAARTRARESRERRRAPRPWPPPRLSICFETGAGARRREAGSAPRAHTYAVDVLLAAAAARQRLRGRAAVAHCRARLRAQPSHHRERRLGRGHSRGLAQARGHQLLRLLVGASCAPPAGRVRWSPPAPPALPARY